MTKKYEDLETIILNENYRSTQRILDSANKLIVKNKFRVHKDLYTNKGQGDPIIVKACPSTMAEADYIAREIKNLTTFGGYSYKDIAILYRSNFVTQDIEKALMAKRINYQIFGGMKFFQRKEIKDMLAYFTLLINSRDDISFERIANVPTRKVGETSLLSLRKEARDADMSQYEYVQQMDIDNTEVSKTAVMALKSLVMTLEETKAKIEENDEAFIKPLEQLIDHIGYYQYLEKMDDGDERVENVRALLEDIRHYLSINPEASFESYLENVTLLSAQDEIVDGEYVSLMTVHTAKGLEFPVIFIVRCNQEVFPNGRALMEGSNKALEEERRLFYVAITRAKKKLYITFAGGYSYVGKGEYTPSQFIKESGNAVPIQEGQSSGWQQRRTTEYHFDDDPYRVFDDRPKPKPVVVDTTPRTNGITDWQVGDVVIHKKFGKGKVISLEGDNIIKVEFENEGIKTLMGNHPSLSRGE